MTKVEKIIKRSVKEIVDTYLDSPELTKADRNAALEDIFSIIKDAINDVYYETIR
jgi:hypothetical protein